MPTTTLDCQGLACPEPVLRTRALLDADAPDHCCVIVDNAIAATNVQRFLEQRGYAVSVAQPGASQWHVTGTAFGAQPAHTASEAPAQRQHPTTAEEKILVFITTETLGRGDDTLGTKLMGTFLSTLPEMGPALWRIVLLNGGVKLSATEGPALTALQQLHAQGVSILVCGTCLAHYGLAEKKAVGDTSNMLDIVTSLQLAHKVIRP